MEYQAGYGHGGLPDRDKIRDMIGHTRKAVPRDLLWEQTDSVVKDHYWLRVDAPAGGRARGLAMQHSDTNAASRGDAPGGAPRGTASSTASRA